MQNYIEIKAYAKVNLALAVFEKMGEKHLLDSIISPVNIYDTVYVGKNGKDVINISYDDILIPKEIDTAYKAAELLKRIYGFDGIDIKIVKRIPLKAGLGGSSADAAGVVKALEKLFDLDAIPLKKLAEIGSDVPGMYMGGDQRITGFGEICQSVNLPQLYKIILLDRKGVDTAECYRLYDEVGGEKVSIDRFLDDLQNKKATFANTLQKAGSMLNGNVAENIKILNQCGFSAAMSGSGSAVVGYAYTKEEFQKNFDKLMRIYNLPEYILG